jgi:hypothetical protein
VVAGLYVRCLSKVHGHKLAIEERLGEVPRHRSTTAVTAAEIRERVRAILVAEGYSPADDDIAVELAPLTPDNLVRLPRQDQAALSIARGLADHEIRSAFVGLRVTIRPSCLFVRRTYTIETTGLIQGAEVAPLPGRSRSRDGARHPLLLHSLTRSRELARVSPLAGSPGPSVLGCLWSLGPNHLGKP